MLPLLNRAVELVPEVKAHLSDKALEVLKSIGTYDRQLWKYCLDLYRTGDGGTFLNQFIAAIGNQITRAWNEGAREVGVEPEEMTDTDKAELKAVIDSEYDHVLDLGEAIIMSRNGTMEEFRQQFRPRVDLWVARYNDAANRAKVYFGGRQRLVWTLGATEEHCETCAALNGIVAFASEWEQSGIKPQSPPNEILACGGWQCDCSLELTDKRRSPDALGRLMDIATAASVEEKSMKYSPDQPRVPAGDSEGGQWMATNTISVEIAKDIVSKLSDRFGMPNVNVVNDITIGAPANAALLGGGISIDTEYINEYLDLESKYNDTVAISKDEVIVHEYGHIIYGELLTDEKYFGYGLSRPGMYYERGIGEQARDTLGQRLYSISQSQGKLISEYASKNDLEYFSEAFVLYNRGEKWHDKIHPELLDIFKRIDNVE